jgi:branched-chain amino acid transport system substrate-binding protein
VRRIILTLLMLGIANTAARADIVIGVAGPLTGQYAAFGAQMLHGVQTAVDDINATGGIAGEIIFMQPEDDGCDNHQAEVAANDLVAKNARVVIGHFCSTPSLAAARIYEVAGIPMIAPSASLPVLTEAGLWNVVRIASRDDAQADFAAKRILHTYPKAKVAMLDDGSAAGANLAGRFKQAMGAAPVLSLSFKPDAKSFDGLVNDVKLRDVEVIYFACGASDAGRIAADLQAAGVQAHLFGADLLLTDQYWEKSGAAGEGTLVSFSRDPQSSHDAKAATASLQLAGFDAEGATLPAYAAVQLFVSAAQATSPQNGRAVASWLHSGKPLATVLGPLAFDAKGDVQPPRFVWYKWSKGAYAAESPAN